jgi:iron(III) transport system substrate-binding protein
VSSITTVQAVSDGSVTVYSSRKEHLIKPLFEAFTKDTGIKVEYLTGKGGALIERLKLEGTNTKADMFMTVDAGNLWYAGSQDLFQSVQTDILKSNIPSHLRDPEGLWTGLSIRARTIVYNTDKVKASDLSTYADLASPKWNGRLCLRTSKKIYTKSLVASIIYNHGEAKAGDILSGWVNNLAATPHAKDSHVMNAILAGQCDVGLVNTYYYGRLIEKNAKAPLKLFWANQDTTGVHVNISGAGVTKHGSNSKDATTLLEWLSSAKAQSIYGSLNKEYPANQSVASDDVVSSWGSFKQDNMNLAQAGILQAKAVKLMQIKGYK